MSFGVLALVCAIGLLGPLLALPTRWRVPVVIGELLAGIILGHTGLGLLNPQDPTFTFIAEVGFALVMYVAGTHVPVRDPDLMTGIRVGGVRAALVGLAATGMAAVVAAVFGTGHVPLYAVLMASSSAAIVMPIITGSALTGRAVVQLIPQIAIADAVCIVALPLVLDPPRAPRAALGSLAVIAAAAVLLLILRYFERTGVRRRIHRVSEDRGFAVELRVNLTILFSLAALAAYTQVSIMLAGFSFGLAVAAIGTPRRLTKQMFALTEGFLGPVYFAWLGASLDLRELLDRPAMIGLGIALGGGAVLSHLITRLPLPALPAQPVPIGVLAASQLGVPVSAVTLGTGGGLLMPGEGPAIVLGALVTLAAATVAGSMLAKRAVASPS